MGIGTSETLIAAIRNRPTEMTLEEIAKNFSRDGEKVKIAIDSSIERFAVFCAIWSTVVDEISRGDKKKANDEFIIEETKKILTYKNRAFFGAGLIPHWCMEGNKSENKLATKNRSDLNRERKEELLKLLLKAEKACQCGLAGTESANRIKNYSYIRDKLMESFPKFELEYFDEKKEDFAKIFSRILVLAPQVRVYPKNYFEIIDKYIMETKEFNAIRVPEISEAEKLGSILTQLGFCEILFTTDSDAIVLGAKHLAKKTPEGKYAIYSYEKILKEENLTPNALLIVAILMGNDYNTKGRGDGYKTIRTKINDPEFNLYMYNANLCGILRPNICIRELGVSREERKIVWDHLSIFRR